MAATNPEQAFDGIYCRPAVIRRPPAGYALTREMKAVTGFSSLICHWYGEEQHARLAAVDHAMLALEFLAMQARQQQQMIPDCPVCEAWSSKMLPVHDLINTCGDALADDIRTPLESLWAACCALKALELPCYDRGIFEHGAWQTVRAAAHEALTAMESALIKPLLVDLVPK